MKMFYTSDKDYQTEFKNLEDKIKSLEIELQHYQERIKVVREDNLNLYDLLHFMGDRYKKVLGNDKKILDSYKKILDSYKK